MSIKSNLDGFDATEPVDKTAALVIAKSSVDNNYLPCNAAKTGIDKYDSDLPYRLLLYKGPLIGKKFDRLTVIGYTSDTWVSCKCVCGKYCLRKVKSLIKVQNNREVGFQKCIQQCWDCKRLMHIKSNDQNKNRRVILSDIEISSGANHPKSST